jgi:serine/threonine-protein kinase
MPLDSYRGEPVSKPAASAPRLPEPGDVIGGKYRVENIIGQGGMGAVYRARHVLTERAVALKWMLPDVGGEEAVERFLREAKAMGRIDHPGVVGVYDVGFEGGAAFLVMELLRGSSLREVMPAGKRFNADEAIPLLMPALEGLEAAHAAGVVHRDLKPENIFLVRSPNGRIENTKVLDFGISKLRADVDAPHRDLGGQGVMTRTGVTMGTPSYMSPEQVRGARDTDARSDVWAVGVILYEMLAGRVPFVAESFGGLVLAIATEPHTPLHTLRRDLSPILLAVLNRTLAKDPDERFASVAELAQALLPFGTPDLTFRTPAAFSIVPPEPLPQAPRPKSPAAPAAAMPELMATVAARPPRTPEAPKSPAPEGFSRGELSLAEGDRGALPELEHIPQRPVAVQRTVRAERAEAPLKPAPTGIPFLVWALLALVGVSIAAYAIRSAFGRVVAERVREAEVAPLQAAPVPQPPLPPPQPEPVEVAAPVVPVETQAPVERPRPRRTQEPHGEPATTMENTTAMTEAEPLGRTGSLSRDEF